MAPPCPPFTAETARTKVKLAQTLWNTKDPAKVAKAYTLDSEWRNRDQFMKGHEGVIKFLTAKWEKETKYRLRKELFCFTDNKIAVNFWYEYFDVGTNGWRRCYGLEHWTFNEEGSMYSRQMSGNETAITEDERWFKDDVVDVDSVDIPQSHGGL